MTLKESLEYADTLKTKSAGEPRKEFISIAKSAIEKQIPIETKIGCPTCGKQFLYADINNCPYCGQALIFKR